MRVEYERWCLHNMKYITSNNRRCELSDTGAALAAKAHDARSQESAHVAEPRAGSENEVRAQKKKNEATCTRSTRCPGLARQCTARSEETRYKASAQRTIVKNNAHSTL